ncbi:MAG: cytochrome c oxidase assembly protein [Actinomycetota bacterium]|nr:cytochrome c oxidase assembly protein [Actinomycetota bacterium]
MDPYSWSLSGEALLLVPTLAIAYAVVAYLHPTARIRIACFAAGLTLIVLVFVTPVQTLALHYLLSAHLLQNVVLAEWAPALCVLGLPPRLTAELSELRWARLAAHPLVALPVWLGTYFIWHVPWIYDSALEHPNSLLHLEHLCYFAAGVLLWWPVLTGRLAPGSAAAYLFAAFVLASPLGLLLALLPDAVYSFYEHAPRRVWGLSASTDQQIAGLTMAAEQAVVFFGAFTVYFLRFLGGEDRAVVASR